MKKLLKEFVSFLDRENQVMDSLSKIGDAKKELIILGKVKELDELIRTEGTAINELHRIEEGRFKLQKELADKWGKDVKEVSAIEILENVRQEEPAFFDSLNNAINRLDFNLTRLSAINTHNTELLEDSLDYIQAIEVAAYGDKTGVYSNSGVQIDEDISCTRKSLLDKKI